MVNRPFYGLGHIYLLHAIVANTYRNGLTIHYSVSSSLPSLLKSSPLTILVATAMSAFALRKRLLNGQAANSPAPAQAEQFGINEAGVTAQTTPNQPLDTASPRRSKRTRLARPAPKQDSNPEAVLEGSLQKESTTEKGQPLELLPVLPRDSVVASGNDEKTSIEPPPILLSNFKPSKGNYQKRKDGRIHLKLVDGDVCLPPKPPSTHAMKLTTMHSA